MSLDDEIRERRKEIQTDGYPMSIGELMNMYRDGELDIQPEYQRYFRWSDPQKSRLIESLLLGIPIPSVFVHQRDDGVWDVIDGLQRLSTIFEFSGILRDSEGQVKPALTLVATRYLPSLSHKNWDTIGKDSQLLIKRSKIDVKIVKRESDGQAKYELFQRLNTGGSALSDQELRNCIVVMIDRSFLPWLRQLANVASFQQCVQLSERQQREQYDLELIVRFLVLRELATNEITYQTELSDFLTDKLATRMATMDRSREETAFRFVFEKLADDLGEDAFKSMRSDGEFRGKLLISAFEALAIGLGYYADNQAAVTRSAREVAQEMWQDDDFRRFARAGVAATTRIPRTVQYGRDAFRP